MSTNQATNSQPASSTWSDPPWSGWIETTGDALLILEAARRGLIPRITRRLVDSERKMITSGSVFVFDEDESGIKRWTDGFFWSPSRILGNFLLYRETDKRGAGHRGARSDSTSVDGTDPSQYGADGGKSDGQTLSRPKGESGHSGLDKQRERTLVGSLTNSYKFKSDGLMKKTFSLTIGGVAQHLISYYKIEDVEQGRLRSPSSLPELACLVISPDYLDKTHFRNPPRVETGPDGIPRYRGEADDIDNGDPLLSGPISGGLPIASSEGVAGKRTKRYDPYNNNNGTPKRNRKTKSSPPQPSPPPDVQLNQAVPPSHTPAAAYPEPSPNAQSSSTSPPHSHYPPYSAPSYYPYPMTPSHPPHMFASGPYPGANASTAPQVPASHGQQVVPYAGYTPPPPNGGESAPTAPSGQHPYYPYYPPAHGHYPSYAPWPHYSGYPHPQVQQSPTETESKPSTTNGEAAGSDEA